MLVLPAGPVAGNFLGGVVMVSPVFGVRTVPPLITVPPLTTVPQESQAVSQQLLRRKCERIRSSKLGRPQPLSQQDD